jgi:dolichyl-phosphate-mannose--protein O-mannosyl transferase
LLIGTPLLWWVFIPMLLWLAWHWFTTRDWRAGAIWLAFAAGWLVWFQDLKRTMFLFYMAPLLPFMVFGVTMALGAVFGPVARQASFRDSWHRLDLPRSWIDVLPWVGDVAWGAPTARLGRRRVLGSYAVSVYLAFVIVDFAWMYPVLTGGPLSTSAWNARMWLPSWI